jgi:hypothetical protein
MFFIIPVCAKENTKPVGVIQQNYDITNLDDRIAFKISNNLNLSRNILIPRNSIIMVRVLKIQDCRRWHKSAFLLAHMISYIPDGEADIINVEDKDIYILIRKYDAIDKKQAAKTAAEITATTAAAFVLPGVDIAYYFTKGAIKKEEGKTRFKSGVSSAYTNSIFWFWLKGKPLDLGEEATIIIKEIDKEKAMKLKEKIEKRTADE